MFQSKFSIRSKGRLQERCSKSPLSWEPLNSWVSTQPVFIARKYRVGNLSLLKLSRLNCWAAFLQSALKSSDKTYTTMNCSGQIRQFSIRNLASCRGERTRDTHFISYANSTKLYSIWNCPIHAPVMIKCFKRSWASGFLLYKSVINNSLKLSHSADNSFKSLQQIERSRNPLSGDRNLSRKDIITQRESLLL